MPTATTDLGMYIAYLTIDRQQSDDNWWNWQRFPGLARCTYGRTTSGTTRAMLSFMSDVKGLEDLDRDDQIAILRRTFADAGGATPRMLAALDDAPMYFDALGQVRAPRWSKGRVALLGDAAFCPSPVGGGGSSLALIGAYVLAGELSRAADHAAALAGYEQFMRPHVAAAQNVRPAVLRWANPRTRAGIRVCTPVPALSPAARARRHGPGRRNIRRPCRREHRAAGLPAQPGLIHRHCIDPHELGVGQGVADRAAPLRATSRAGSRRRTTSRRVHLGRPCVDVRNDAVVVVARVDVHPGERLVGEQLGCRDRIADDQLNGVSQSAVNDVAVQQPCEGAAAVVDRGTVCVDIATTFVPTAPRGVDADDPGAQSRFAAPPRPASRCCAPGSSPPRRTGSRRGNARRPPLGDDATETSPECLASSGPDRRSRWSPSAPAEDSCSAFTPQRRTSNAA